MMHGHRPLEPRRARELLAQLGREVACVEEARLGIDPCLLLRGPARERAMDQEERGDGHGKRYGFQRHRLAKATPRAARTRSVARLSPEKSPVSRSVCPRAKWSIVARRMWFMTHEDDTGGEAGERHRRLARSARGPARSALPPTPPARSSV